MLKFFHRHQKSFLGVLLAFMMALTMLPFGAGVLRNSRSKNGDYAIKVGEQEVSFSDVRRRKREVQDQYRRMLGDRYGEFATTLLKDIDQKIVDGIVEDTLISQEAGRQGFHSGDGELKRAIRTDLFRDGFSPEKYSALLQNLGLTTAAFEERISEDLVRGEFRGVMGDLSFASELEARTMLTLDEISYDLEYLEISPASQTKNVADPPDAELQAYYDSNATEFEQPARASFSYVTLDPKDNLNLVELHDEDIEMYFVDNRRKYSEPDQVKVRHIQLLFPEKSDPKKMAELKETADQIHSKVQAGEDIGDLALQYSDDVTTKMNKGDLGWIKRGTMTKEFEEAVFKQKGPGLAPLISTDTGYQIAYVDEYKEPRQKELEEVKPEIEKLLREQEAPAYTLAKAQELYDQWLASQKSLNDFAQEKGLKIETTPELFTKGSNPNGLPGMTAKVLEIPDQDKQLIDVQDKAVLVQINEYRDVQVPPLAEVKPKLLEKFRAQGSQRVARELSQKIVDQFRDGAYKSLSEAASQNGLKVEQKKDLKSQNSDPIFDNPDLVSALFIGEASANKQPDRYFEINGAFYIARVTAAKAPDPAQLDQKFTQYREQAGRRVAQNLYASLISKLKAESAIDIRPGVLTE